MKATISGKRYDSERCEEIASRSIYDHSNNYAGSNDLLLAADGTYLICQTSNGQDCYRSSGMYLWDREAWPIDNFDLTDEQEARCAELGLIEIV